jgi:hypothetical protein
MIASHVLLQEIVTDIKTSKNNKNGKINIKTYLRIPILITNGRHA